MRLEWIIPVIIAVVWVLGAILKAKEALDARPKAGPERNPGRELDQFLQEIERLRRDQESKARQAALEAPLVEQEPTVAQPIIIARPIVRQMPVLPRPRSIPTVQPAVVAAPRSNKAIGLAPAIERPRPGQKKVDEPSNAPPVVRMTQNPQLLAAAIVLQEVLGPPKCKRQ